MGPIKVISDSIPRLVWTFHGIGSGALLSEVDDRSGSVALKQIDQFPIIRTEREVMKTYFLA